MRPRLLLSLSVIAAFAFGGAPAANADIFDPVGGTGTSSVPSGRYLVKFAAGTSEADQAAALAAAGANDLSYTAALRLHSVTLPDGAVDQLRAEPSVDRVEAEQARAATATPSDPGYPDQWSLEKIGWNQVYGSLSPSGSATVALLDTGVDASHADLAGNVVPGTSILDPGSNGATDSNGHGTEMAGIVAASTDNGEGIAGVGYAGVNVMPVTVLDSSGVGQDGDIINGVIWAADHGADVILMAFSSPDFSPSLQEAIDYAWSQGAVLVGATGNDGSSASHFPAGDRGVVGVANTDVSDALNTSSNYGEGAFMAAPGTGIYTTTAGGGYATITGTSASAAAVAGAAALLKANDSAASNGTVVGRLARNAEPTPSTGTGNGRLNLARAVGDDGADPVRPEGSAPVGGGGPLVGPYVTAAATDGTGTLTASPTTVAASSTGNNITFTFTSPGGNAGDFRAAGSNFTITVPSGWSAPQTANPAGPGHVSLGTVNCPSQQAAPAASVSGNVITVTNRCNGGLSIEVDYSNVTAPSTPGSFTFNATSQEGNAGSAALTGGSPSIAVKHGTTAAITNSLSTPAAVNQPYAVDVSVTRTSGTTTPTGTATVSDGSANCVAPLSGSGPTVTGSCNLTSTTAGAKTITATYNGDATYLGSTSPGVAHTVNAFGTATKLRFVQQPSNVVAGQPITPAVTAEVIDDFNNRVTSSTAPVTMSLNTNPGGATLGGTLTRNAVSGLATFNDLTLDAIANGYSLAAASAGLTAATSSTFDATPGTCTSLSDGVWNAAARWSCNRIPTASDDVTVAANHDVTIPLGFSAVARSFSINPAAGSNPSSLTLSGATSSLAVSGDVRIQRPGNNNVSALNVNAGSMTVGGSVTLDGTNTSVGRVNRVAITTGTLDINGNLVFVTGTAAGLAAQNVVDMTGGNGTLNLAGAFTAGASGTNAQGTLSPGTTSTFNFDGTSAQTIPVGTAGLTVTYNNLHTNNTSSGGATPSGPISSTNVTGNLRIQSGTFDNGGQGIIGGAGDTFEVANGATFRLSGSTTTPLTFTKTFGATSTTDYAGGTQNIGPESYGNLSLNGTGVKNGPNPFSVRGNWTLNTGTSFVGAPAAPVTFTGTAANQHIGGALPTTFNAMTVDKTSGTVTLDNTTTATGALGLTNGAITTGANAMIANGAVNRTLGFINGNERRPAVPGTTSLTFDVGTGSTYSPAALNFASVTSAGTVTAAATATEHPNIATSGIRPDKSVNRYWTLTPGGGLAFTNYSATFTFVAGDVDAGANTGNFVVKRYDGTNWHATTTGTQGATSTQATGITSMSDFAVGEADAAGPVTSNTQVSPSPTKTAPTVTANVNDATTGGNNVTATEYFIDSAGADGTGTAMDAADGTFNSVSENVTKALTVAQFNALSDGQHTIYVHGRDVAGNWGATESANFTKDTTGPTNSITFPADNGVYNTAGWNAGCPTPGICGTASDPSGFGAVRVSIKRNSDSKNWDGSSFVAGPENFLLATGAASWSYALAASNLTDGVSYTVHAKGTDALTNQGGVTSATFTYDATAPTVGVEQAAGQNDPTKDQPIHFTATFSEPVTGFAAGDVNVGGTAGHASPNVVITPGAGNTYEIAIGNLSSDGTVTASIDADKVQDAAGSGNSASTSVDNEVTLDQTKPHSAATSPAYSNADDSTIPVDYTAGDNAGGTGLDKVELWAKKNDGAWALADTNETPGISGTFTYTPSPGDGTYRFYTIAVDNAGNRENVPTEADAVTVKEDTKTLRDTVAPAPTLTAPPAFTNDNTPAIAGTAGTQAADETHSADGDHVTVTVFSGTTLVQTHNNVSVSSGEFTVDATHLADGVYTAHVDQSDAAGNTGSDDKAFEVDTLAPDAPTIDTGPADPTKETTADFAFTPSEAGGTLECKLDSGSYVECDSRTAQSYTGLGEGSHTFSVRQVDVAGNQSDPDTFTWFVDLTAPTTSVDSTPDDPSNDPSPTFTFSGTDNHSDAADLTFECKLDDGAWHDCDSPDTLAGLAQGSHDYYVRATDEAGNTDASPAQFTWFVDLTAPTTSIDSTPADPSNDTSPTFTFSGTDNHSDAADLTFECKLDDGEWYDCSSPEGLEDLEQGSHTLRVRATDEAGNTDATPAEFTWFVDLTAPDTTIDESPSDPSNDDSPSFEFSGTDNHSDAGDLTFECKLDDGAWHACSSPEDLSDLADGEHTFKVRATDEAGNTDGSPASFTWVIDTVKPQSEASSPATTNDTAATFEVHYSASDERSGLNKVELYASKNGGAYALANTDNSPGATGTFNFAHDGDGTYRFYTLATDNADNVEAVPVGDDDVTVVEDAKTLRDTVAPTVTLTAPPANTNDDTPEIAGTAGTQAADDSHAADDDHVTVEVLDDTDAVIQTHPDVSVNSTTGAFSVDASHLADGDYTAKATQADGASNSDSDTRAFTVDTAAPDAPTIDSGPDDPTKETTADFAFTPSEAGGTLECKLDGGSYAVCDSRTAQSYTSLSAGSHTFSVRQVDVAGNQSDPDTFTWFVDLTAPTTSIDTTPADPSNDTSPTFTFSGADNHSDAADLTFECKLDDGAWYDCSSPDTLAGLAQGSHDYYVRATDEAGNTDASPAQFTWFVDLTAPTTSIDSTPADPSNDTSPSFTFSGADNHSDAGDLTFECKLDDGAWYDCSSPEELSDLDDGEHTFKVRATDEAGNTDASPASFTWVVDTVKPQSEASSPATTNDTVATFEVHYTASDERSGLDTVDLWASKNGGAYSLTNTDNSPDDTRTFNFAHDGDGTYRFYTIATDKAGNVEAVPVGDDDVTVVEDSKTLRDTVAPTVTLSAPPENTNDDTPRIAGKAGTQAANDSNSADDDHVTVEVLDDTDTVIDTHNNVSVDSAGDFFVDANHLEDGDYTAKATQADGATNSGTATRAFTVDTDAPAAPTIDSGPGDPTKDTSAAFTFHGDEPGGTLECKLDGGSYQTCDSPQDYDSLGEGSHTFSVRQVDAAGNPSDPDSATWFVDVTEPNTSIGTKPSDPDNDATPDFSFSGTDNHTADGDLTFECQIDGLGWNSCSSPKTLATLSDGEHTFEVRATDKADNTDSTPASYTWTVDTDTPDAPNITNGPGHLTKLSDASFEWTGEAGGEFECKVDAAAFSHCHSPEPYVVGEGHHTFSVRQIDDAGNTGPAAAYEWDVDQTNPNTSIGTKPANPDNDPTPDFTFTGTDNHSAPADLTFECQIDGLGWNACNSPKTLAALTDGEHTFEVRATDQAGNTDATPASWTWTVDTGTPAAPAITSPADNSFNNTGNVTVQGTAEAGASVEVFDGATSKGTTTATGSGSWSKALTGVADGSHPYTAKATDAAHNTSGASNSRTVVVDTVKPASQASAPATSSSNSITVTYTASDERSGVDKVELYAKKDAGAWTLVGTDTDPSSPSFSFTATGNGTYGFYTRAYDKAGNPEDAPATADATTVVSTGPVYNFSGFKEPVNNLPTLNLAKAGSNIPLKFSLGGYKGMNIFWTGYPKSESILCNSTAPVDGIESTDNPGNSALTYDAATDTYHYNWKTDKSWSLCRQLVMRFADGTSYGRADFKFSK